MSQRVFVTPYALARPPTLLTAGEMKLRFVEHSPHTTLTECQTHMYVITHKKLWIILNFFIPSKPGCAKKKNDVHQKWWYELLSVWKCFSVSMFSTKQDNRKEHYNKTKSRAYAKLRVAWAVNSVPLIFVPAIPYPGTQGPMCIKVTTDYSVQVFPVNHLSTTFKGGWTSGWTVQWMPHWRLACIM